jgi:hypothetical protein
MARGGAGSRVSAHGEPPASPGYLRRASDGLACAHPSDRVDSPFVGGAPRSTNGGPFVMQSDRKSRLITICMLASALVMIGLALTGTLQMRVSHSPITRVVPN